MSPRELPDRLLTTAADDLERRLVAAIADERPSPELSERMAQAIGVPSDRTRRSCECSRETDRRSSDESNGRHRR